MAADEIQDVRNAESLLELHLYDSNLTSLRDVRDLSLFTNLQVLNLHCNHLSSLSLSPSPLSSLSLSPLSPLVHLRELNLSSNDLESMQGLQRLSRLEILNLASNRLRVVDGLDGLSSLKKVILSFNFISDLSGFSSLNGPHSRLHCVDLRGNRVDKIEELYSLSRCPNIRFLSLQMEPRSSSRSNPVCSSPGYRAKVFKSIPSLFSLDGYDVHMKPIHENDEQDLPSLAPYSEFMPDHAVRRPVSASASIETPHIDQVLQRHSARRNSATHRKSDESKSHPPSRKQEKEAREANQELPLASDHEKRLAKLEAQLAARLSARKEAREKRGSRVSPNLLSDSESNVTIDEDFDSTSDLSSVSSVRDSYSNHHNDHHNRKQSIPPKKEKPKPITREQYSRPLFQSEGVQTDVVIPRVDEIDVEGHPTVVALYEEIGSLQKKLEEKEAALQQARTQEKDTIGLLRELQTSVQQANIREHGLREAQTREKDFVRRQTQQMDTLQQQVEELNSQLRAAHASADAAEDQRRTLQGAVESLRTICEAEKSQNKQKEAQIERLNVLLRDRQGEELSQKGKEGELLLELQRAQAQLMVYHREADDIRELKRERLELLESEANLKEDRLKMQNTIQNYQITNKAETAKLRELQRAYEELAHSHAELKQVARAAVHKEGQASALVQELTLLVKKLKHKEQKLSRNYQYLEEERDLLLDKLHQTHDNNDYDPLVVDKERKDAKKEIDQLLNERDTLLEQISSLQTQLNGRPPLNEVMELKTDLDNKTDALRVKDKMLDDQNDTIHQLKSLLKEKEQELSRTHKLEDELNSVYDQLEDAKHREKQALADYEKKDRSLRDLEKAFAELEEECDSLHASGKKKSKHIQELEEQYSTVEHTIRKLREESEKLYEQEAKRTALLAQQVSDLEQQKEEKEQEIIELREQLQQATNDAAALVALADKMRKKDKAARARGAKAKSQLDHLHKIMTSIVKQQDIFNEDEDGEVEDGKEYPE